MSGNSTRIVGRVVTIVGLVAKPEMNGKLGVCESFNENSKRFGVRILPDPTTNDLQVSIAIKRANFELFSPMYEDLYPDSFVVPGSRKNYVVAARSILDFSMCTEAVMSEPSLLLQHACSLRGTRTGPATILANFVCVFPKSQIDVFEFEDITFTFDSSRAVSCNNGVTYFRRCTFRDTMDGASFGNPGTKVVFESCCFENCTGSGVEGNAEAVLVNCAFNNLQKGVELYLRGSATLLHCSFSGSISSAVSADNKAELLHMKYCTVQRGKTSGVLIAEGSRSSKVLLESCLVVNCEHTGVMVLGPKHGSVVMRGTIVRGCQYGVVVQDGNSHTEISNCQLVDHGEYALAAEPNAVGTIVVTDTVFLRNRVRNINNGAGALCKVTVDGELVPQIDCVAHATPELLAEWADEQLQIELDKQQSGNSSCRPADVARASQMAGLASVRCAGCAVEEPSGVRFKLCSRCRDYHYCSAQCQKRHWKEHKKYCLDRNNV